MVQGNDYRRVMTTIAGTLRDDSGASAIEFGLLAALVSVAAVAGFSTIGDALQVMFSHVSEQVEEALYRSSFNGVETGLFVTGGRRSADAAALWVLPVQSG